MSAWTCASCGGENPEGMRFCGHCGAQAEAAVALAKDAAIAAGPLRIMGVEAENVVVEDAQEIDAREG